MNALPNAFWANVDATAGINGCWLWTGNCNDKGYGRIRVHGEPPQYAHRLSLAMALGRPLAEGMQALHRCDNPPCVNPRHLYEGSHLDNARDAVVRDRVQRGRLSPAQVSHIRRSDWRPVALATAYGVSVRTVYRAMRPTYRPARHSRQLEGNAA